MKRKSQLIFINLTNDHDHQFNLEMNDAPNFLIHFVFLSLFLSLSQIGKSQAPLHTKTDSILTKALELSEIPKHSAETRMKTMRIIDRLLSENEIVALKNKNDSINKKVKSNLMEFKSNLGTSKSIRYLENRKLQLVNQQKIIKAETSESSHIITNLDNSLNYLYDEKDIWLQTKKAIKKNSYGHSMTTRISNIEQMIDSAIFLAKARADFMLVSLDKSSEISFDIEEQLTVLENTIQEIEQQVLSTNHPNIFNIDYRRSDLDLSDDFYAYLRNELLEVAYYLKANQAQTILLLIIFIAFIYLFKRSKRHLPAGISKKGHVFKMLKIVRHPINTAIILSLFATVIIYNNRPLAFRDVMGYLLTVPLMLAMRDLLPKHFRFYIYAIATMMLLNFIFVMLPPENGIFRINLLIIAFVELYLTIHFLRYTLKKLKLAPGVLRSIKALTILFMILSFIGIYGAIFGNVMLAQIVLLSIYISLIVGALLYIISILSIGGIIFFLNGGTAQKINYFRSNKAAILQKSIRFIHLFTSIWWLILLLQRLKLWNYLKDGTTDFFNHTWAIGRVEFSLGSIFMFFVVIYLSIQISKTVQSVLKDDILNKMPLPKGMPHTIAVMARYTLITFGVVLAVSAAGLEMSNLTVIIGAFGVGIGFGLQNIFNNLVSGLILLFERPVQIGDTIELGALIGEVKSIGIRSSNIHTFDGAEVIVPNGNLISNEVINWTLSDQQRRIEVIVGVSYNADPHQVQKLLKKILLEHKEVLSAPAPEVFFNDMGESSLDFRLLFWTASFGEWIRIRSEVVFAAFDILEEHNIEIPFPQRDIHVRSIEQQLQVENTPKK